METNKKNDDTMNESTNSKESDEDKSFVTKVRSRVSGLLSSSLSRLFKNQSGAGVIRPRSNEDEEGNETNQPPCKKPRGMETNNASSIHFPDHTVSRSDFMNHVNNRTSIESTAEAIPGPSFNSTQSAPRIFTSTSTPFEAVNKGNYVSSECTSGYSSMIKMNERQNVSAKGGISESTIQPNGNITSDKRSLFNMSSPETPSRSLFSNMSPNSQDKNASLSSRRPSFNASNLGSPSFVDRTLTTNRIINSPFYNGTTMYGGASAYGQQLAMNETRKQQLKNSFMVKPINRNSETKSFTSLSKTARRILETLEQYSSPMSDVKKVPLPNRTNKQGLFSKYAAASPYSRNSSMSKELLVPSVSERLKMKQIQRLQDTTNEIRQIASSSNSNLNQEDYKISTESQQKHTNKMKTKVTSVRQKAPVIEVLDDYILNPVPLMLPENKCPTFKIPELNIGMPKEKSEEKTVSGNDNSVPVKDVKNPPKNESTPQLEKSIHVNDRKRAVVDTESNPPDERKLTNDLQSEQNDCSAEYTFSKPVVIADNAKSIIAINNFKFSEPLSKKIKISESNDHKTKPKTNETGHEKLTNGSISCESDSIVVEKTNDPLLEKFKPPEGTWECQTCLIRNKSEVTKCAACETPKTEKSQNLMKAPSSSFGLQFTKKIDEWDCSTCLVRNKLQSSVCVACSTPKVPKLEANGITHKIPSKEWECETCWVRNKSDADKCVACESKRGDSSSKTKDAKTKCPMCLSEIGSGEKCSKCDKNSKNEVKFDFPSHLKPATDSWECGTCLIRNKNEVKICAACETPREKQSNDVEIQGLAKKSDKWECPTCMVRNDAEVEKCPCCETAKPGVTLISKNNVNIFNFGVNKMQFSFGIPKDMQSNDSSVVSSTSSLFGNNTNQTSSTTPVFSFGITPNNEEKGKVNSEQKNVQPIGSTESKSEVKPDSSSVPLKLNTEKDKSEKFEFKAPSTVPEKNPAPAFKFGAPATDSKDAGSNLFTFTPPKPLNAEDKSAPPSSENLKQPESTSTPFAALPVSQSDSSKPLFSFGGKDNDAKNQAPATSLFSFGSKDNDAKSQKTEPLFSFGSSSSSTKQGGFNFNSAKADAAPQQSSQSVPSFLPNPLQQPSNINQGGTTLKNGGFNFGSTATGASQAAVFNFGASSNPPAATPLSKGGFDFSSAVKPNEGFNFSSPAASFDAGPKPSFNFTGGSIPTFSANPSEGVGGTQPVRKFKRAIRRTQR